MAGSLVRKATVDGGSGNDEITSLAGDNVLHGGAGDDAIGSLSGATALFGDAGNDTIFDSGTGSDFVDGGDGDDRLDSNDGEVDTIQGGAGHDVAFVDAVDQRGGIEEEFID